MAALAGAAAISLVACATPVPQALTSRIVSESTASPEQAWHSLQWWQDFGSPQLSDATERTQFLTSRAVFH
jgi:outer membrane protein TolC